MNPMEWQTILLIVTVIVVAVIGFYIMRPERK